MRTPCDPSKAAGARTTSASLVRSPRPVPIIATAAQRLATRSGWRRAQAPIVIAPIEWPARTARSPSRQVGPEAPRRGRRRTPRSSSRAVGAKPLPPCPRRSKAMIRASPARSSIWRCQSSTEHIQAWTRTSGGPSSGPNSTTWISVPSRLVTVLSRAPSSVTGSGTGSPARRARPASAAPPAAAAAAGGGGDGRVPVGRSRRGAWRILALGVAAGTRGGRGATRKARPSHDQDHRHARTAGR